MKNFRSDDPETPRARSTNGDLTPLAKGVLEVIMRFFRLKRSRPSFALMMTLPPDYDTVVWTANIDREEAVNLLRDTAAGLKANEAMEGE